MDTRGWTRSFASRESEYHYSFIQLLIHRIASTKPGSFVLARSLPHLDRIVYKMSGGRVTLSSVLAGIPVVVMTTIGAKSGVPRTVPVLCLRNEYAPETFAIVASNFGNEHQPAWYYNLKAHPRVVCKVEGRVGEYYARQARDEDYDRLWQHAQQVYFGFSLYKQRARHRRIPIFVMSPDQRKNSRK